MSAGCCRESLPHCRSRCRSCRECADVHEQFCLNLPPWVRFRDKNCLALGWIPGPKEAWDKQSFFYPIIREGRYLAKGIEVYDASLGTEVQMYVPPGLEAGLSRVYLLGRIHRRQMRAVLATAGALE